MLNIRIITLGEVTQRFVRDGESEYLARLSRSAKVSIVELRTERFAKLPVPERVAREGELLLQQLKNGELFCALDEQGKSFTSVAFSEHLQKLMNRGVSSIVFAIGGAYGWSENIRNRADLRLSLSPMTFTYQMTRLVLIEQLYRGLSIIAGTPYHK